MKKILIVLSFFVSSNFVNAQIDSGRAAHVRELLEITGSAKLGIQMINSLINTFEQQNPDVPAEFWNGFKKEVNTSDLINIIIPIYTKYYSDDDILQLIQFYKTPLGQKVIEKLPLITRDSYSAGAAWGKHLAEKLIEDMKSKGYFKAS